MIGERVFECGWIGRITAFMSRSGRSYRITVYGRKVEGLLTPPKTESVWIPKSRVDDVNQAMNLATHYKAGTIVRTFYYGQILAKMYRESDFPMPFKRCVQDQLTAKYGKGWLYGNEDARMEAEDIYHYFEELWRC